jgi:hypothetical protein
MKKIILNFNIADGSMRKKLITLLIFIWVISLSFADCFLVVFDYSVDLTQANLNDARAISRLSGTYESLRNDICQRDSDDYPQNWTIVKRDDTHRRRLYFIQYNRVTKGVDKFALYASLEDRSGL